MKIKNIIFAFFFIVIFTNFSYADIPIDDMDFLLDEEASVGSAKKTDNNDQNQSIGIDTARGKGAGESLSISFAVSENIRLIIIIWAVCGLFFLAILYLLYLKTKKLANEAQVSKDLAEKHYFNTKEHFEDREEIKKDVESKLDSIDKIIDARLSLKIEELDKKLDSIVKDTLEKVQKEKKDVSEDQEFIKQGNDNFVFREVINNQDSTIDESQIDDDISDIITSVEKVFDESKKKTKNIDSDSLNKFSFTNENTSRVKTNLNKEESENELNILGSLLTDDDVDKDKNAYVKTRVDAFGQGSKDDQKSEENCDTYGSILDAKSLEDLKAAEFAVLNNINNENVSERIMAEEEKNRKQIIDIIAEANNSRNS